MHVLGNAVGYLGLLGFILWLVERAPSTLEMWVWGLIGCLLFVWLTGSNSDKERGEDESA